MHSNVAAFCFRLVSVLHDDKCFHVVDMTQGRKVTSSSRNRCQGREAERLSLLPVLVFMFHYVVVFWSSCATFSPPGETWPVQSVSAASYLPLASVQGSSPYRDT